MGNINSVDSIRDMAWRTKSLPIIAFVYGNIRIDLTTGGDTHLKDSIHISSGHDVDFCNIFTVKIFESHSSAVYHITYIAGESVCIVAVL